jgi:hypothetical protein
MATDRRLIDASMAFCGGWKGQSFQLQTRLIGIAFLLRNLKLDNAPGITLGSREASVNAWAG